MCFLLTYKRTHAGHTFTYIHPFLRACCFVEWSDDTAIARDAGYHVPSPHAPLCMYRAAHFNFCRPCVRRCQATFRDAARTLHYGSELRELCWPVPRIRLRWKHCGEEGKYFIIFLLLGDLTLALESRPGIAWTRQIFANFATKCSEQCNTCKLKIAL